MKAKSKKAPEDLHPDGEVEHIVDVIGEWGRWQRRLFIFFFILDMVAAFSNMGYSFHAFKVDYWCDDVPEELPIQNRTKEMRCFKFNSTRKCTKWTYDRSTFTATIISEFDLVCDNSFLASISQSAYMMGYIFAGAFVSLSDKFGRRPLVFVCFIFEIIGILSCALSINIYQYIVSRFIHAAGSVGRFMTIHSLFIEITGPKLRADITLLASFGWVFGYCLLPGFALLVGHFRYMQLLSLVPISLMLLWWFSFFESPRWLLVNNQFDRAEATLKQAMLANGKFVSDEDLKVKMNQLKKHIDKAPEKSNANITDIFSNRNILKYVVIFCFVFPIYSFMYYSLSYNIGSFGGNYFINFILGGLVEIPSQLACLFGLKIMGRRTIVVILMLLATVSSCLMIPTGIRMPMALLGKFAVNGAWLVSSFYKLELFPTVLRTTSNGMVISFSRIGAIAAPFLTDLAERFNVMYIFIFYAALAVASVLAISLVPETRGNEIPDTIDESENYVEINKIKKINRKLEATREINDNTIELGK